MVGASVTLVGSHPAQGAAYVFFRSGTTWQQQGPALTSSDGSAGDGFGQAVAVSGDTALIGAPAKLIGVDLTQGAAYAFVRTAGTWAQQGSAFIPSDARATDAFGFSVAISGDTALVGAPNKTIAGNFVQGAAYVFVRSAGAWQQQGAPLTLADGQASDAFGTSVALSGDTALVGASGRGAAYVFVRSGETWTAQGPALVGSGHASGDQFGASVSLSGDTALVGAPLAMVAGAAYVFTRNGTTWTQQGPPLTSPDTTFSFGAGTSLSGDAALVGAPAGILDAAYAFDRGACTVDSGCCSLDSDCPLGTYCPSYGVCQAKLASAAPCSADGACGSGHCVDGVCCDSTCAGSCEACSAALTGGLSGTCLPIPAGQDPKDGCDVDPGYPRSCGADGTCDGNGACASVAPAGTVCGDAVCADDSVSGQLCDGSGSCITSTLPCSPYHCNGDACGNSCRTDEDCAVGLCAGGMCTTQKPPGEPCTLASDCRDGRCVDGFCCDSACDGACQACGEPGMEGQCTVVSGTPRPGHAECSGDRALCGGTCDGTKPQCQYPPSGKLCEQACVAGQGMVGSCDGQGSCRLQRSASVCGAYACGDDACLHACVTDDDCVNGARCVQSQCLTPHESVCNSDLTASIGADSTVIPCLSYTCDDGRGACRSQCDSDADCSSGNVCSPKHECGPSVVASPSDEPSKRSAACGCRVGSFGEAKGAAFGLLLLLGTLLRRGRRLVSRLTDIDPRAGRNSVVP